MLLSYAYFEKTKTTMSNTTTTKTHRTKAAKVKTTKTSKTKTTVLDRKTAKNGYFSQFFLAIKAVKTCILFITIIISPPH